MVRSGKNPEAFLMYVNTEGKASGLFFFCVFGSSGGPGRGYIGQGMIREIINSNRLCFEYMNILT